MVYGCRARQPDISCISTAFLIDALTPGPYRFASRGAKKNLLPLNNVRSLFPPPLCILCPSPFKKKPFYH